MYNKCPVCRTQIENCEHIPYHFEKQADVCHGDNVSDTQQPPSKVFEAREEEECKSKIYTHPLPPVKESHILRTLWNALVSDVLEHVRERPQDIVLVIMCVVLVLMFIVLTAGFAYFFIVYYVPIMIWLWYFILSGVYNFVVGERFGYAIQIRASADLPNLIDWISTVWRWSLPYLYSLADNICGWLHYLSGI